MAMSLFWSRRFVDMSAAAMLAVICACDNGNGNGYVSIRLTTPINPDHPIYVGSTPLVGIGDRVIQQKVGVTSLNSGAGWGNNKIYCKLEIRKDRITIVRVRLVSGEPRCECELRAQQSTPNELLCK